MDDGLQPAGVPVKRAASCRRFPAFARRRQLCVLRHIPRLAARRAPRRAAAPIPVRPFNSLSAKHLGPKPGGIRRHLMGVERSDAMQAAFIPSTLKFTRLRVFPDH